MNSISLVNIQTKNVYVSFDQDRNPSFPHPFVKSFFSRQGVIIPSEFADDFSGKKRVQIEDPDFYRAFKEVFMKTSFKEKDQYEWKVDEV